MRASHYKSGQFYLTLSGISMFMYRIGERAVLLAIVLYIAMLPICKAYQ